MQVRSRQIRSARLLRAGISLIPLVIASACSGNDDASADTNAVTNAFTETLDAAGATAAPATSPPDAEIAGSDTERVTVRPIIACDVEIRPDTSLGQEMLATRDGDSCVVGQIADARSIFETATVSLDATQGTWAIDADVRPAAREFWNEVVAECFALTGGCPSGQIAIVLGDVIQVAPTVLSPDLGTTVRISADYTEQEARAVAAVVNGEASVGQSSG